MKDSNATLSTQLLSGVIAGILAGNRDLYNPAYFYGPVETVRDILYTIACDYKELHPEAAVLRVSGDAFVQELITSIKDGTTDAFREKYRSCNLLAFDHVEQISGMQSAMVEFCELFDYIFMNGGQILIGSSVPPVELGGLDDRIQTQLESGMICHVKE